MAFPILYCCVTVNKKVKIRQKIKGLRDSFNEEKYTCYIPFALKKDISEYYNDKEFLEKIISFIFKKNITNSSDYYIKNIKVIKQVGETNYD